MGIIKKEQLKEYVKKLNLNTSSDVYEVTEEKLKQLIDLAAIRTKKNDRKTLQAKDL